MTKLFKNLLLFMIQKGTSLNIVDNAGALKAECVHVYGKKFARAGDIILVTVKALRHARKSSSRVKKGSLYKAVVVTVKQQFRAKSGFYFKFFNNSIVFLNNNNRPLGTRVFGSVFSALRSSRYMRVVSLSSGTI